MLMKLFVVLDFKVHLHFFNKMILNLKRIAEEAKVLS